MGSELCPQSDVPELFFGVKTCTSRSSSSLTAGFPVVTLPPFEPPLFESYEQYSSKRKGCCSNWLRCSFDWSQLTPATTTIKMIAMMVKNPQLPAMIRHPNSPVTMLFAPSSLVNSNASTTSSLPLPSPPPPSMSAAKPHVPSTTN